MPDDYDHDILCTVENQISGLSCAVYSDSLGHRPQRIFATAEGHVINFLFRSEWLPE